MREQRMNAAERLATTIRQVQLFAQRDPRDSRMLADTLVAIDPHLAQDIEDGAALRRLVEAMPDTVEVRVSRSEDSGNYRVKTPWAWFARGTIAQAADACREALEER